MSHENRSLTGVAYDSAKAFVKPSVSFSNLDAILDDVASNNSAWWNLHKEGDYIYGARGVKGLSIVDVSTPGSANEVFSSLTHDVAGATTGWRCMGVTLIGSRIVTVSRSGNDALGVAYIETWNDNGALTASLERYTSNSIDGYELDPTLYSAVDTDGTWAIVSGQKAGVYVFNPADLASGPVSQIETPDWETQGLCIHNGYVFFANYNNGIRIVDLNNGTGAIGAVTDREVASPIYNSIQLWIWDCVADGNYLYCSNNVSGGSGDSVERGLLVMDITDPTTTDTWIRAKIPDADQDEWNDQGDKPYLGITKLGNYIYMAAGHGGVFVWDVTDPTRPIYKGKKGNHSDGDNIYSVASWKDQEKEYIAYADGKSINEGSHQLYIDQVITR